MVGASRVWRPVVRARAVAELAVKLPSARQTTEVWVSFNAVELLHHDTRGGELVGAIRLQRRCDSEVACDEQALFAAKGRT